MKTETALSFQKRINIHLFLWSAASVAVGALLLSQCNARTFGAGFGLECIIWGLIDMAIVAFGYVQIQRSSIMRAKKLRNVLFINAGLDVIYVLVGILLVTIWGKESVWLQGHGWGVVLQGGFLLGFDIYYGVRCLDIPDCV